MCGRTDPLFPSTINSQAINFPVDQTKKTLVLWRACPIIHPSLKC